MPAVARAARGIGMLAVALFTGQAAAAQMPGAPVLQNAWANPGLTAAINLGGGGGTTTAADGTTIGGRALYGAAAAWAPARGRLQLSVGAGMQTQAAGGGRVVFGGRAAMTLLEFLGENAGIGVFAGAGGGTTGGGVDTVQATLQVPVGVSLGYRRALGIVRGASIYTSPMFLWANGPTGSVGLIRAGVGLDVGLTPSIGVTGGLDFGQRAGVDQPGPRGIRYGLGASWAFGPR